MQVFMLAPKIHIETSVYIYGIFTFLIYIETRVYIYIFNISIRFLIYIFSNKKKKMSRIIKYVLIIILIRITSFNWKSQDGKQGSVEE